MPTPGPRIIDQMDERHRPLFTVPLDPHVATALVSMFKAGLMRATLADEVAATLIAAGYAHRVEGGLALTDVGVARALMETGR